MAFGRFALEWWGRRGDVDAVRRGSAQPCSLTTSPSSTHDRHTPLTSGRTSRLTGTSCARGRGHLGTTGPLDRAVRAHARTSIGFWRVLLGTVCLALWDSPSSRAVRVDRAGWCSWASAADAGRAVRGRLPVRHRRRGCGGAAAMLYTAPVMVAVLAHLVLKEALTPVRLVLRAAS